MTLALILIFVAIFVEARRKGKIKQQQELYRTKNITNVKLQRELFCHYYKKFIEYLEVIDEDGRQEFVTERDLKWMLHNMCKEMVIPTPHCLFNTNDSEIFHKQSEKWRTQCCYSKKDYLSKITLLERIFLSKKILPPIQEAFFGTPNAIVTIESEKYHSKSYLKNIRYDEHGESIYLHNGSILANCIFEMCVLCTKRALKAKGFNWAKGNDDSAYTKLENSITENNDIARYPWAYD